MLIKTNPEIQRIHGLDTLRACAILLVMMYHYMVFVSNEPSFGVLSEIGWAGVDLFFVLSGYLIGNQIFSEMRTNAGFSLTRFYARRALRTLPNYYFILAIYFLFPVAAGGNPSTPLWKFLTFTQNFDLKSGSSFSHAWSLCIEEQFYVLLPLISLLVLARLKSVRGMWIVIVGTMMICACMRYLMLDKVGVDGGLYRTYIYYSSWCRFDELLPGVALALVKNYHPLLWQEWTTKGGRNLVLGLLTTGFAFVLFQSFNYDPEFGFSGFTTTFGYTILACGFGYLTLAALSSNSWLARIQIPGAASLAIWSYALYLVHKPLMNALIPVFHSSGLGVASVVGISLMFLISIFAAYLQFLCIETPFMRLRSRLFPSKN